MGATDQYPAGLIDAGLSAIGRSLPWFEGQLRQRNVSVQNDSGLGASLVELRKLMADASAGDLIRTSSAKYQRHYLAATGADFLSKALHWGHLSGLTAFDGHWRYLRSSNPVLTAPSAGRAAQERAFAWELVLASMASTFCGHVFKEEPDLICEWEGRRIAIAAKVLFESTRTAFVGHVRKGIKQIQDADADGGCVVINLVDVFPPRRDASGFSPAAFQVHKHRGRLMRELGR